MLFPNAVVLMDNAAIYRYVSSAGNVFFFGLLAKIASFFSFVL